MQISRQGLSTLCNTKLALPNYYRSPSPTVQFPKSVATLIGSWEPQEQGEFGDGQRVDRNRVGDSRSRTPWTRRVVGSRRPRLDTGGAGLGEARSREASKRSSATAGRSRRIGHHRATSRTARCPKLRTTFLRPARARRGAAAPSSSDTVMEMLRIVDDGIGGSSGGEVVAVVGLPFTGWA